MAEAARIPCPACGGLVHPIAGRCKHCKADLHALRGARPTASAKLPSLGEPAEPVPTDEILPPRATGWQLPAAPAARFGTSPLVVLALVAAVGAIAVVVVVMTRPDGPPRRPEAALGLAAVVDAAGPDAPPQVRPPVEADLAEYTKDLPPGDLLNATIETSLGTIRCTLFDGRAPATVANFVGLATGKKSWKDPRTGAVRTGVPFYDGLIFHRVIEDFMIQGGDPLGAGTGGPGYTFDDEIDPALPMQIGTLAMANAGKSTNGSQFFITETAPDWLNGKHTIFGRCGQATIVKRIARVPADAMNKPTTPVVIKSITITRE